MDHSLHFDLLCSLTAVNLLRLLMQNYHMAAAMLSYYILFDTLSKYFKTFNDCQAPPVGAL